MEVHEITLSKSEEDVRQEEKFVIKKAKNLIKTSFQHFDDNMFNLGRFFFRHHFHENNLFP